MDIAFQREEDTTKREGRSGNDEGVNAVVEASCVGADGPYSCQALPGGQSEGGMEQEERVIHDYGYGGVQDCAARSHELDAADCKSSTLGIELRERVTAKIVRNLERTASPLDWMVQGYLLVEESLLK